MHFFTTISLVTLTVRSLSITAHTSPVTAPAAPKVISEYIPLRDRAFPEADYIKHEALHKRSSAGYCTFSITYGQYKDIPLLAGLDKMENDAAQFLTFVDRILAQTNSTKVFLLGHSEGSVMPRYYLEYFGGQTKVAKYAAIGSIAYGTSLYSLVPFLTGLGLYDPIKKIVDPLCLSCFQILQDSPFLKDLNEGGDTVPGVAYHFIVSKYDELVTPYTNGFLKDTAINPKATNVELKALCPLNVDGHLSQMFSALAFNSIRAFFDTSRSHNINCLDSIW
ncbi:hypothetical protein BGZ96_000663 [Linnemannia gamsii]|uniref:Alpha/beta-hydrolase n=1 Tax=Linnemannia gamsii TaxID=64522 RepID=A0ABQ7JNM1_9FUNG|nr:hypothetical protein BGZ96_000663 [Linnemannia gamsii]